MFDEAARSPSGALGLMQIMPETGRQISREIASSWEGSDDLLQASTNIKFGTYYYKQMMRRFSQQLSI
jgi:soluble lytic murein transglycosylase